MNAVLRRTSLVAVCAALCLGGSGRVPAVADGPPPVIWCASDFVTDSETARDPNILSYQAARKALCEGDAAATVRASILMLPDMRDRYKADGTHWIDFGRTYFYALLATHDDGGARRFLSELENDWKAEPEERSFWGNDFVRSFAGYVADDATVVRTPDQAAAHKPDVHLSYALADVKAKDPSDAALEMRAVADTGSLYELMLGNLYAEQKAWPEAFDAWIAAAAAGPGSPQMEFYTLDRWNESALEMIYFYRSHAPDRAVAETAFCGSPHDLAAVEALALGVPQAAGLDATSIIDAAVVGGTRARVDVQSKGQFTVYSEYRGEQWVTVPKLSAVVTFPSGCANPRFVNHASGA